MALLDMYMISGDSLQAARKIGNSRSGCALAVEKEAQPFLEGVDLDEILQTSERGGIASLAHQSRGEGPNLPFPMSDSRRPHRPEWRVVKKVTPGKPLKPRLAVPAKGFRKAVPLVPNICGDRESRR